MLIPDGYIRRTSSTIPFGYEETEIEGYLKPIPTELNVLEEVSLFIKDDTISLGVGVDWIEAQTGRKMSRWGLLKHVNKVYGRKRSTESNSHGSSKDKRAF
jgi:hypothetical protein